MQVFFVFMHTNRDFGPEGASYKRIGEAEESESVSETERDEMKVQQNRW